MVWLNSQSTMLGDRFPHIMNMLVSVRAKERAMKENSILSFFLLMGAGMPSFTHITKHLSAGVTVKMVDVM